MSRVGNSLDNRSIEFFFGLFKTEYLSEYLGIVDFDKMEYIINESMIDYNEKRILGHMNNRTPLEIKNDYLNKKK